MGSRTFGRAAAWLAAGGLAISLGACGSAPAPNETPAGSPGAASPGATAEEQITLRLAWWGSDSRHAVIQQAIELFEAKYPNIDVQPEYTDWGSYFNKLSTSAAANDLPDVMAQTDPFIFQYIDNGQLLDLNTVKEQTRIGEMPATSNSFVTVDGKVYGMVAGVSGFGIAIDPAAFEAAGVPLPDDKTWSWDDYLATAAAITKATPEVSGSNLFLYPQVMQAWLRQHGEDFWKNDGTEVGFTAETAAGYWEFVKKLIATGATPSAEKAIEDKSAGLGLEQGGLALHKVAMDMVTVNQLGAIQEAAGRPLTLVMYPGESQASQFGNWVQHTAFYSIAAATEHPAEAALLADWLVNEPEVGKIFKFDRGAPANPNVIEAIKPLLGDAENQILDYSAAVSAAQSVPQARPNSDVPYLDIFDRINQQVVLERLTPQEAAEQFLKELNAEL